MSEKSYYIYIATNFTNRVLYIGVTNNIVRRMYEHINHKVPGFTSKYHINKLVYFEVYKDIESALNREKQLKAGSRRKKIELIKSMNPDFKDLYKDLI